MTLLKIKNLSVSIKRNNITIPILKNINLNIEKGSIVALVGESGSGKTITLKSIVGLISNTNITSGEILFNDIDIVKSTPKELQKIRGSQISIIFQDPLSCLNPTLKIGYQIFESVLRKGMSHKQALEETYQLLESVKLSPPKKYYNFYPHEMSGGMRQRVLIACALSKNPELLIADEPTSSLDCLIQSEILNIILKRKEAQLTTLLVTHNIQIVQYVCDYIYIIHNGSIIESGITKDVIKNPQFEYTKHLLSNCYTPIIEQL